MREYAQFAIERAVKTFAQSAVAVITAVQYLHIAEVDWLGVLGVAALSAVLSLLTSVATYKGPDGK
jgi:hypothetical protein